MKPNYYPKYPRFTRHQRFKFDRYFHWTFIAIALAAIAFLGAPLWIWAFVPFVGIWLFDEGFDRLNDPDWFPSTRLGRYLTRRHAEHASRITHAARRLL